MRDIPAKTEDFVLTFLLPIFFAYSGLKTQVGLLNSLPLWGLCGLVLLVAIAGKYIGTFIAARVSELSKRDAFAKPWDITPMIWPQDADRHCSLLGDLVQGKRTLSNHSQSNLLIEDQI